MKEKRLSIVELLVVVAIVALLGAILFPVYAQARVAQKGKKGNEWNLKQIARAVKQYSQDYDDRMPVSINGPYRDLRNIHDGVLTTYGEQRSDMWPLLLMPYLKDRTTYIDPQRGDAFGIWSGPPLATSDAGYNATANTYRNQDRFPMFAMNFLFLSPMKIPASKLVDATPTDFMQGESHSFQEAEDPNNTVFFGVSERGRIPQSNVDVVGVEDWQRGFWGIDAPALWDHLISSTSPYVTFWTGTNCSGDWCGTDLDPVTTGTQSNEGFFYKYPTTLANNAMFLDLHIHYMTAAQLAQGTDYLTATPNDGGTGYFGGGATITDKSAYLWNLNEQYYGA